MFNLKQQIVFSICLLSFMAFMPQPGRADTFNIADGDVAGLIAAIQTANNNGEVNTINLAPKGTYLLTAVAEVSPTGDVSAGLPFVISQLTINGNGATIERSSASGTPDFLIIQVSGTCPACLTLTLNGVTLQGGSQAGLRFSNTTVTVQNSTITQNTGVGGIYNYCGNLTVTNSTISYNSTNNAYGGGGIMLFQVSCSVSLNVSYSTIYENTNPGWGRGNAIGTNASAPILVKNSILASPSHPLEQVCNTTGMVSLGHNLGGDASCAVAFTGPGDINNTDPLLGPLADNGGPTPTFFPAANSPAIGGVAAGYCTDVSGSPVPTDQRGFPRQCPGTIGSVEFEGLYHVCLLYDPTKAVRSGATYPVKLQLCDSSGNDLSSSTNVVNATSITQTSTMISGPVQSPGDANPDNDFRFDSSLGPTGGYIFNLKTTGLATGSYILNFTVTGDSFIYPAPFQVK